MTDGATEGGAERVADVVRRHALRVLARHDWHVARAAEALGVSVKTAYNWLAKWEAEGHIEPGEGRSWVER